LVAVDWVLSEEYQALYLTALAAVTQSFSTRYTVVTGLPLTDLHLVSEAKPLLMGNWQPKLNSGDIKKTIRIDDVAFVAQGIGALFLLIIDKNGHISDPEQATSGRAGILDVGSKTTNIIAVDGIQEVAVETGTAEAGTWMLEDTVRRYIVADNDGWGERVSRQELMATIIGEKVVYDGNKRIDITEYVDVATTAVAKGITDQASSLWSDGRHLRRIIVCGGGAKLMMGHIKERFSHAQLIGGDPQLANVRGYHRYAKFLASHAR
jgi:plasmid segregation protein ParM